MPRGVTILLIALTTTGVTWVPYCLVECQRPEPPPPLSSEDMADALRIARDVARAALTGRDLEDMAPEGSAGLTGVASGPVAVTVYGVGLTARGVPPHGVWFPESSPGRITVAEAVQAAAAAAGKACKRKHVSLDRLDAARIKVDIGGETVSAWSSSPAYLTRLINNGVDGLIGVRGDSRACVVPSWIVERGWWRLDRALRYLRAALGGQEIVPDIALFRTRSFVEGVGEASGPLRVYRASVQLPELTAEMVRRSIARGGAYLARMVKADGRYCYTYFAGRDRCDKAYNLLRHAGTTYALFQAFEEVGDPAMLEAAEKAVDWLRRQTRPVSGDPDRVYLIEGRRAKLGAAGLALLALVERQKAVEDGRDLALMKKIGNFILSRQHPDGFLESWFDWGEGADVPRTNSIYYPGEALLGLVRLYSIDPDPRWLEAAKRAARFLAHDRWRWGGIELYVPPDAWLTQGLAELDALVPDPLLRDYVYEIIEVTDVSMLRAEEGAAPDLAGGPAFGLFMPGVTPAGSRNEGLTAAYRMAVRRGQRDRAEWIEDLALRSARFQLLHQFRPANSYFLPNPARAMGGFRSRPDKLDVRIDYVQHNLTGLLGVLEILSRAAP